MASPEEPRPSEPEASATDTSHEVIAPAWPGLSDEPAKVLEQLRNLPVKNANP